MLNIGGNHKFFVEAGSLTTLACGRSIKNSMSVVDNVKGFEVKGYEFIFYILSKVKVRKV
jgi:hypothetical protein